MGRPAVDIAGQRDIFPINFVIDGSGIVFRSAAGTKLAGAVLNRFVAFEIDCYLPHERVAWSVEPNGTAGRIDKMQERFDAEDLPLFPWLTGEKPNFVRIDPTSLTGRRYHIVDDVELAELDVAIDCSASRVRNAWCAVINTFGNVSNRANTSSRISSLRPSKNSRAGHDHRRSLAGEIESDETVEGEVSVVHPVVGTVDLSVERQDERGGVLGHRVRRVFGDVDDREAVAFGGVEIDVVESGATQRNDAYAETRQLLDHDGIDVVVREHARCVGTRGQTNRLHVEGGIDEVQVVSEPLARFFEAGSVVGLGAETADRCRHRTS